jgi:hypothetical protein
MTRFWTNPTSFAIEGVLRQYFGNEHAVIKGIGLVNCVYYNRELDCFWVLDYYNAPR